jgi:sulfide dehydrogenase cytochrome subunit
MPLRRSGLAALFAATCSFAQSSAGSTDTLVASCYGCHGPGGVSHAPHMPTIAGLNFRYFYATMQAFRKDRRDSTIMGRIARGYKSGQLQMMALYFGSKPWTGRVGEVDEALAHQGRALHVECCEECHKENGRYQDKDTPPLAGQARGYLYYQMLDYREDDPKMDRPPMMQSRLEKLSDDELLALAEFYASDLAKQ